MLTASRPAEALRLAELHSSELDLLITDVVMPEMNGRDLAAQLQGFCPKLKTLYMSGFTANVVAGRGILPENVNVIQKPFSRETLATQTRALIDQP